MPTDSAPVFPYPGGTPGAEPPDPTPGQPGHIAWSSWIKQFVVNLNADKLAKSGDTMAGELILVGNPVSPLGAAPKQYVDSKASTAETNAKGYADGTFPTKAGVGATGTWPISITGNAPTATKLATARTFTLGGDLTGSVSFDGTANVTFSNATVKDDSHSHTNYAPLASPAFTGTPTAPTPAGSDSSTQLATTAFVKNQGYAQVASPTFTGTPTAPTPSTADSSTKLATTAFVKNQGYAPLLSPSFSGTPSALTPDTADNSTRLATTAYVKNQEFPGVDSPNFIGSPTAPTPPLDNSTTRLATTEFVKGQGYAPIASPAFTGSPTATTQGVSDSSTKLATTAFVKNQGYAQVASPAFTGTPTAPTPTGSDNSTKLATTAYVKGQGYATLASPTFTGAPKSITPADTSNDTSIATTQFVRKRVQGRQQAITFNGTGGVYVAFDTPFTSGNPSVVAIPANTVAQPTGSPPGPLLISRVTLNGFYLQSWTFNGTERTSGSIVVYWIAQGT